MTSVFTVLLPSSGESFLLETEHNGEPRTVLVDAGRARKSGANSLRRAIETKKHGNAVGRIDIAICTHADSDHAGGFPNFIESWCGKSGKTICEIWLPAAWVVVGEYLPKKLPVLLERLNSGAQESAKACFSGRGYPQEKILGSKSSFVKNREATLYRYFENVVNRGATTSQKEGKRTDDDSCVSLIARLLYKETEKTVNLMTQIIKSAHCHGIKIRWFDFAPFKSIGCIGGGEPEFLIPLNSVERMPIICRDPVWLFAMLYLTTANKESLVFQRVEEAHEPGVLFLADSELAIRDGKQTTAFFNHSKICPAPKMKRPCIYTAPHHGSHNNDHAYDALEKWFGPKLFKRSIAVKNGGVWNQKAGKFKHVCKRVCARGYKKFCGQQPFKQTVQIKTRGRCWDWPPAQGYPCRVFSCRP